jgi:uncharacterized membrane protein YecN with MAPEG domain
MHFPVTTFYAAILGILLVVLSDLVSRNRKKAKISLGSSGDPILERAVRAHGNFVEYVPLALILLLLLEGQAAAPWMLHALGGTLLAGRLLHVYGMIWPDGKVAGRFWGTGLTWLMVLCTSLLNLWRLS